MRPGDILEMGFTKFVVCSVLNDLMNPVLLPLMVVEGIQRNSGILKPSWPLGVYVIFTLEGISVGIYGRNTEGSLVNGVGSIDLEEDKVPPIGEVVWQRWKRLRKEINEEELAITFNKLRKQTEDLIKSS